MQARLALSLSITIKESNRRDDNRPDKGTNRAEAEAARRELPTKFIAKPREKGRFSALNVFLQRASEFSLSLSVSLFLSLYLNFITLKSSRCERKKGNHKWTIGSRSVILCASDEPFP